MNAARGGQPSSSPGEWGQIGTSTLPRPDSEEENINQPIGQLPDRVEAPVAYGIDFGMTADGRTVLVEVEVNDGYSLGHLGLRPVPYANMLEDRWVELVTKRRLTSGNALENGRRPQFTTSPPPIME